MSMVPVDASGSSKHQVAKDGRQSKFEMSVVAVDAKLPMVIDNTLRSLVNILIYLALIAYIVPWFLIAIPITGGIFVLLYAVFQGGLKEIQRLHLVSLSPLLSHIDVTLRGLSSIKAFGRTDDFKER